MHDGGHKGQESASEQDTTSVVPDHEVVIVGAGFGGMGAAIALRREGIDSILIVPAPYSYTGLSFFFTIEGQMHHIARCMRELRARGANSFEVKAEAQEAFVDAMVARGRQTVWARKSCVGTYSYYFDSHGQPSLVRPMTAAEGGLRHRFFPLQHYRFE